jgi:hypothetical protein
MLTLQPNNQTDEKMRALQDLSLEGALRHLAPSMTRLAAETAGAFFCAQPSRGSNWETPLRSEKVSLHCSQMNMGERFEMTCNLAVEKDAWSRLFNPGETDQFQMDAFCEMANCICGSLIGDPGFLDEFGYLIPCVPWPGISLAVPGSRTLRGAFRISGILVYVSFTVRETVSSGVCAVPFAAAA